MSLIIKKNTTFKIPRTGSGAPSGFPNVGADGQQISVTTPYPEFNGIYTKVSSGNEAGYINASRVYDGPYISNGSYVSQLVFNTDANRWEIGGVSDWSGDGNFWAEFFSNPSSNQNVIPTTGWSATITITAV